MQSGSEGVRGSSQGLRETGSSQAMRESEGPVRVLVSNRVQAGSGRVRGSSQGLNESEGPIRV